MKWYEYVIIAMITVLLSFVTGRCTVGVKESGDNSVILKRLDSIASAIDHYQTVDKDRFNREIDSLNSVISAKTKNIEEIRKSYEDRIDHIRDMPNADADSLFSANLYWISKNSSDR